MKLVENNNYKTTFRKYPNSGSPLYILSLILFWSIRKNCSSFYIHDWQVADLSLVLIASSQPETLLGWSNFCLFRKFLVYVSFVIFSVINWFFAIYSTWVNNFLTVWSILRDFFDYFFLWKIDPTCFLLKYELANFWQKIYKVYVN